MQGQTVFHLPFMASFIHKVHCVSTILRTSNRCSVVKSFSEQQASQDTYKGTDGRPVTLLRILWNVFIMKVSNSIEAWSYTFDITYQLFRHQIWGRYLDRQHSTFKGGAGSGVVFCGGIDGCPRNTPAPRPPPHTHTLTLWLVGESRLRIIKILAHACLDCTKLVLKFTLYITVYNDLWS